MKTIKIISIFYFLIFSISSKLNAQNKCEAVFDGVRSALNVTSDRSYLNKLHSIYSSTTQREIDEKRSQSGSITVPKYDVTGSWASNKEKVQNIYNKYAGKTDFFLSVNEKMELSHVYIEPDVAKIAIKNWMDCINSDSPLPSISYEENKSSVTVILKMSASDYRRKWQKVKVRNIVNSDNLEIDLDKSSFKKGDKIKYSGEQSLYFKRIDSCKDFATISIILGEGRLPILKIPSCEEPCRTERIIEDYKVKLNIPKNYMRVYLPYKNAASQTFTYPNQTGFYNIPFSLQTDIKHKDIENISWSFIPGDGYNQTDGAYFRNSLNGDFLNLDGMIKVKRMTKGTIRLIYDKVVCPK